jgi:hypothetical protein
MPVAVRACIIVLALLATSPQTVCCCGIHHFPDLFSGASNRSDCQTTHICACCAKKSTSNAKSKAPSGAHAKPCKFYIVASGPTVSTVQSSHGDLNYMLSGAISSIIELIDVARAPSTASSGPPSTLALDASQRRCARLQSLQI